MKPNSNFLGRSPDFWANAKLISEKLGYSKNGQILSYLETDVLAAFKSLDIRIDTDMLRDVLEYLNYRSHILNSEIQYYFMDVGVARNWFSAMKKVHDRNNYICKLPFNKQTGAKKDYAYFTGIINILTERTLRKYCKRQHLTYGQDIFFDDNPMNLTYIRDENKRLIGILSRRFDGAYPSTINPLAVWEIKEYYYTTTFGSRIADGVYETQLDGFEINSLPQNINIKHIYFIDDHNTWWNMGKSYLCRIIDMLHVGLVDEVIFGKEVLNRWPALINEILYD